MRTAFARAAMVTSSRCGSAPNAKGGCYVASMSRARAMASASGANASSFPSLAVVANSSGSRIPGSAARPLREPLRGGRFFEYLRINGLTYMGGPIWFSCGNRVESIFRRPPKARSHC